MPVLTIRCGIPSCPNHLKIVNQISEMPSEDIEPFFEAYGHGAEDAADVCPQCHILGLLTDEGLADES